MTFSKMDAGSIAWIVFIAILGTLLIITCLISGVKAVKDREKIKQKIAAKQAARIILQKPSVRGLGRHVSRSSDDLLTPIGLSVSGGGLIAERMRTEQQRQQQNKSPTRKFESVTGDWRSENRLERRQYVEKSFRRRSGCYDNCDDFDIELQSKTSPKQNYDPYYKYFSSQTSNDKLYVDRRWNDPIPNGNTSYTTRSSAELRRPTDDNVDDVRRLSPIKAKHYESSKSLPSPSEQNSVQRSQSEEILSRQSSRQSVRRNSYAEAIENEDYISGGLTKSERIVNVYRYYANGNTGMDNRAYMKSDDVLRQVSI